MRAVMPVALPEVLRLRRQTGADRFDEMWDGVLHMPPAPSVDHQDTASRICAFFLEMWVPRTGGLALVQPNVSTPDRWDRDYRIPDVAVVTPEHRPVPGAVYVLPAVVFEVRSPDDETFEKLPFYAAAGVRAVVIVERDTKAVQVFTLAGDSFVLEPPGPDGWLAMHAVGVEVRSETASGTARLALRLAGEPASARTL
jgi:Uma2 family endonuclease